MRLVVGGEGVLVLLEVVDASGVFVSAIMAALSVRSFSNALMCGSSDVFAALDGLVLGDVGVLCLGELFWVFSG